ncbi:MAG TPA: LppP/LprE family lipoprotein [Solirubrobacteraceae bacterium]|nr:LppP/LprE family lipoprotein [Solirubrobacteraceae bacterium]
MLRRAIAMTAAAVALLLALGGCGSGTKTVTVNGPPAGTSTGAGKTAPAKTSTTEAAPPATSTSTTSTGTHTAPEPAFTEPEDHAEGSAQEGLAAAEAVVREQGFTPNDPGEYHSDQTLRVLIGTRTGSGDGYGQRAFFFVDGRYLGTDTKEPSATLAVTAQSDTEVALAYPLYHPKDPLCCASAGKSIVHFQLNNGRLVPLQPIPPASSKTGPSRL